MKLPILAGGLRGAWWLPASGGKVLRVLLGRYEPEQTCLFARRVAPRDTVIDVGAHAGYYTLLGARLVGASGLVVAFEPSPRNCVFLRRHVALNGCGNVRVEEAAAWGVTGAARFRAGTGTGTGRIDEEGEREVRTVRLDDYCAAAGVAPSVLKIDVEGAELEVLRGGAGIIGRHRPWVFLSTHGEESHGACLRWLRDHGYRVEPILGKDVDAATEVLAAPGGA